MKLHREGLTAACIVVVAAVMLVAPYKSAAQPARKTAADTGPIKEPEYKAPPLAELNAKVKWVDQKVVDPMKLLREHLAKNKPQVTVEEALKMRNTGKEANAKILSALGRLPETDSEVNYDATITRHLSADIRSTNPLLGSSVADFDVGGLTGAGLFGFDWNMEPFAVADSVVSWQSSADGLYDKVVMRDDLTWSDGEPLTAEDVEFSFNVIMDPRVVVPTFRSGTEEMKAVKAYDKQTLVFFHKRPLATNVWNVNYPIIPKHIYAETIPQDPTMVASKEHRKLEVNPVTGGAYTIENISGQQEIVLKRRESYYLHNGKQVRDKPYFKNIRFKIITDANTTLQAIQSADIDDCELTAEQWTSKTGDDNFYRSNTKATGLEWTTFHFCWNCERPYFTDRNVRKAMSYAMDYKELINTILYGLNEQAAGPFHPTSWMAPKKPSPKFVQDLDEADQLLSDAGWDDSDNDGVLDKMIGGTRVKFEFTLLCAAGREPGPAICGLMQRCLKKIRVKCNVKYVEFTALQSMELEHNFDAAYGGWGTGTDPDTSDNIWTTKAIKEGRNFGKYSNPEIDKLFDQGKVELDKNKRAAIYARIQELLVADQPYTWLFHRSSFYAFNKELRGYYFSPRGPYGYSPGFSSIWRVAQ